MRVAYLNADCGIPVFGDKGASIHIQEMVRAMQAVGADVRVVATRPGRAIDQSGEFELIHAFRDDAAITSREGREAKEAANMEDAEAAKAALLQLYRTWPFDMIYERYSLWSKAGVDAARELNVPLVVEVNAPLLIEQQEYRKLALGDVAAAIEHGVFSQAHAIVTVSSALRDYVIAHGADGERVTAIGNAVDTARFNASVAPRDLGLPQGAFTIGFTGSLKRWHGVDVMMEAFRIAQARAPELHLVVIGDGPERGWIDGFVRGARLEQAVTMTGWINHHDLPSALAAMDVAIAPYPYSTDFYFSPLKLFEYLASGRSIVASGIGQITELVRDGENGVLVQPGNVEALVDAILALRANPALAARLALAAAREGAKHSWKRNAEFVLAMGRQLRKAA
jgi:glycosyltransferase involved in cell wall biosynthesis